MAVLTTAVLTMAVLTTAVLTMAMLTMAALWLPISAPACDATAAHRKGAPFLLPCAPFCAPLRFPLFSHPADVLVKEARPGIILGVGAQRGVDLMEAHVSRTFINNTSLCAASPWPTCFENCTKLFH